MLHGRIPYTENTMDDYWQFSRVYLRAHRLERSHAYIPRCYRQDSRQLANPPLEGDSDTPWTGYTWFVDDRFSDASEPWNITCLHHTCDQVVARAHLAYGDYDDLYEQDADDYFHEEPWVVDSGTTFRNFPE